jgi:uncharacterized protein (TIGR02271 family)
MTTAFTHAYDWRGRTVVDRDGDKIGKLDEVYLDDSTGQPEWVIVNTGLFGTRSSFVPLAGASPSGEQVRVSYEKSQVKNAPSIDPSDELTQEEEAELYSYYGLDYSEARSETGLPEGGGVPGRDTGRDVSGPTTDDAMTRSEEELHVGTARHERGRARLRKYVVTEEVQRTVPVQREEVRVEREPITDANVDRAMQGPEISEEEHEMTLHEEEPVVEKRTVPKERVRLDKETVTDQREVSEEVRKERIDTDPDAR